MSSDSTYLTRIGGRRRRSQFWTRLRRRDDEGDDESGDENDDQEKVEAEDDSDDEDEDEDETQQSVQPPATASPPLARQSDIQSAVIGGGEAGRQTTLPQPPVVATPRPLETPAATTTTSATPAEDTPLVVEAPILIPGTVTARPLITLTAIAPSRVVPPSTLVTSTRTVQRSSSSAVTSRINSASTVSGNTSFTTSLSNVIATSINSANPALSSSLRGGVVGGINSTPVIQTSVFSQPTIAATIEAGAIPPPTGVGEPAVASSMGINTGQIAGIAIGASAGIALFATGMYLYKKKKRTPGSTISRSETPISNPQIATPPPTMPKVTAPMRISELMRVPDVPRRMQLTNSMQILAYRIKDAFDSDNRDNRGRPESQEVQEVPFVDPRTYMDLNGQRTPPVPPMPYGYRPPSWGDSGGRY